MGFLGCSLRSRGYNGPRAPIEDNENQDNNVEQSIKFISVLSVNCDLTNELPCDEQIKEFAVQKCRKVAL